MENELTTVSDRAMAAAKKIAEVPFERGTVEWWRVGDRYVARVDGKDITSIPKAKEPNAIVWPDAMDESDFLDAIFALTDEESTAMVEPIYAAVGARVGVTTMGEFLMSHDPQD